MTTMRFKLGDFMQNMQLETSRKKVKFNVKKDEKRKLEVLKNEEIKRDSKASEGN